MNAATPARTAAEIDAAASDWLLRRESGLSPADQVTFEQWCAADPRHPAALARCAQTWTLLDQPRRGGRADEMMRTLSTRARHRSRQRRAIGATAALALLAVGFFWQRDDSSIPSLPASAVVLEPEKRLLPDGGTVELRAGAEIAVDYHGPLRRVTLLRGEALFHVAENKARPFVVTAAGIEVRAVGTAFLVQLGGEEIDVVVTHGRVAVERPAEPPAVGAPASAALPPVEFSTLVDAGRRVTVNRPRPVAPPVLGLADTEMADRLAWRVPRLEFSNTPLAEAVTLLNRHSALKLVVADSDLARVPVNGLFRTDNTETLVRLMERSFGVRVERAGNTITLHKGR